MGSETMFQIYYFETVETFDAAVAEYHGRYTTGDGTGSSFILVELPMMRSNWLPVPNFTIFEAFSDVQVIGRANVTRGIFIGGKMFIKTSESSFDLGLLISLC